MAINDFFRDVKKHMDITDLWQSSAFIFLVVAALAVLSFYHFLLYHVLVELFAVLIGFGIFVLVWNTTQYLRTGYLVVIGIAYFFVAAGDLLHTLSYKGMNIFTEDADKPTQLWIFTRYFESLALLGSAFFKWPLKRLNHFALWGSMMLVFAMGVISVFADIFPVCYAPETGLSLFKIASEYIIVAMLLLTMVLYFRRRADFDPVVLFLVELSLALTILAEIAFTSYKDVYGIYNIVGHELKLVSFFVLYKAIVQRGLRQPVKNLFGELKQKTEALEEANKTKDRFFSIIAHDLKNPFNTILGYTDMLINRWEHYDSTQAKQFLEQVNKVGHSSYALVENLLEWSRSQTNRLSLDFINLPVRSVFAEMEHLYAPVAEKKQVHLQVDQQVACAVYADYHTIHTVLRNLTSNAIKYTPAQGTVKLQAYAKDSHVHIVITDDGIGMKQQEVEQLFNLTDKQSRRGTDNEMGTGLGLILVKEFVEKNNGRLDAHSKEGQGSTFSVILPKGEVPELKMEDFQ